MKKRKWLALLCVVVLLAVGVAVFLSCRISLYEYALSLPDDTYFVNREGNVWVLNTRNPDLKLLPLRQSAERAGLNVSRGVGEEAGDALPLVRYALRCGGLIRQDGSFWYPRTPVGETMSVSVFLTEAPEQERVMKEGVSLLLMGVDHYSSRQHDSVNVSLARTVPEALKSSYYRVYSSVCLEGKWYRLNEKILLDDKWAFDVDLLPQTVSPAYYPKNNWMIPEGLYRIELYGQNEPLYFLPFRVSWEGTTITLTEE